MLFLEIRGYFQEFPCLSVNDFTLSMYSDILLVVSLVDKIDGLNK